jgi:hypothetical protein
MMMMMHILSITETVLTGKITEIARRDLRHKYYSLAGRQGITLPEGTGLYFY